MTQRGCGHGLAGVDGRVEAVLLVILQGGRMM